VYFARYDRAVTMDAGRRLAALTHGDPAAWEGTAILHELLRVALDGGDPVAAVPETLAAAHPDHRARYATVLAPRWTPAQATEFNGAVWPCLGSAVWALRTTTSYETAVRAAVDLGGDTDTVAAVTGALAGAAYGPPGRPPTLDRPPPCPPPRHNRPAPHPPPPGPGGLGRIPADVTTGLGGRGHGPTSADGR
jgi:ADP-ribosylglycohydrolase